MSNQTPNNPRRRRIAGERKPGRPVPPGASGPPEEEPSETPAAESPAGTAGDSPPPPAPPEFADQPDDAGGARPAEVGGGAPLRLVVGLAVTFLVLVVVVAGLAFAPVGWLSAVRAEDSEQASAQAAPASAERAAEAILSYNYKALDTDEKSAVPFMTRAYAKKYSKTFDSLVRDNATKLHAKVAAKVSASGVSNASADRANVLLFVNQTTTSTANGGDAQTALNRVMFEMVKQGGSWLVNGITSY